MSFGIGSTNKKFSWNSLPGLERRLQMVVGNLQYHLQYLEKKNLIRVLTDEDYARYLVRKELKRNREKTVSQKNNNK